jgi:hypothetical protein
MDKVKIMACNRPVRIFEEKLNLPVFMKPGDLFDFQISRGSIALTDVRVKPMSDNGHWR